MRFVEGSLGKDRHFRDLKASDNRYDNLVNEIVKRASGVFLWVFLVVQSLRWGLCNSDTISELQDRLQILPTELEEFFQHILDSVEKVYHRQAARLYLMCLSTQGVLTTMTASFFDEKAPNFALTRGSYSWNQDEIERRTRGISQRILARGTDLIEVSKDDQIEFLHRTVHDFLHLRDVQDLLIRRAGAGFDAHQYICNATLSQLLVPTTGGCLDPQRLYGLTPLVENFLDHVYEMELHSNFTNVPLLEKLDREVRRLRKVPMFGFGFPGWYQRNWLVPVAVQRGLYGYLCQEIGQVRYSIWYLNVERPLLDFALRPMAYPLSPRQYNVSPDARVVSLLLENGAVPKKRCGEVPIWKSFMDDRFGLSGRTKVKIIEMLIVHGADLTGWDKNGHVKRELSSLYTSEEAAGNIFDTIRGKEQRSYLADDQDRPSK